MTSEIFYNFLVKVNEKFRHSNSDCVLFLDIFSGHVAGVDRCSNDNTPIESLPCQLHLNLPADRYWHWSGLQVEVQEVSPQTQVQPSFR